MTDPYRAFSLVESVCDDMARDETSASLTSAAGAAWHLLALLAAERRGRSNGGEPISRVQAHLREHLASPVSVPALAKMAGFSPSHFSARFRAVTGFSVTEYVKRLRMARARQLLITSERTVAEIAAAVGYRDPFYFSRHFSSVNGVSPRDFEPAMRQRGRPSTSRHTSTRRRRSTSSVTACRLPTQLKLDHPMLTEGQVLQLRQATPGPTG